MFSCDLLNFHLWSHVDTVSWLEALRVTSATIEVAKTSKLDGAALKAMLDRSDFSNFLVDELPKIVDELKALQDIQALQWDDEDDHRGGMHDELFSDNVLAVLRGNDVVVGEDEQTCSSDTTVERAPGGVPSRSPDEFEELLASMEM